MQPAFLDESLHRGARASFLRGQRRERSIHDQGIASGRIRDRSLAREVRREDREDQSGREGRYEGRFYVRRFCSLPAGIVEDSTGDDDPLSGEWGVGSGEKIPLPTPHSPLPTPHSYV